MGGWMDDGQGWIDGWWTGGCVDGLVDSGWVDRVAR